MTVAPSNPILDIDNLVVGLGKTAKGPRIIDGVSLQVRERETLCLVGESGSGKSVTSLTTMGLLQKGSLAATAGSNPGGGRSLLTIAPSSMTSSCCPPSATTQPAKGEQPSVASGDIGTTSDEQLSQAMDVLRGCCKDASAQEPALSGAVDIALQILHAIGPHAHRS